MVQTPLQKIYECHLQNERQFSKIKAKLQFLELKEQKKKGFPPVRILADADFRQSLLREAPFLQISFIVFRHLLFKKIFQPLASARVSELS